MVREADLYQQALVVRYLNPYRRPLSVRQQAALVRIASNRRAESARKAAQLTRRQTKTGITAVAHSPAPGHARDFSPDAHHHTALYRSSSGWFETCS